MKVFIAGEIAPGPDADGHGSRKSHSVQMQRPTAPGADPSHDVGQCVADVLRHLCPDPIAALACAGENLRGDWDARQRLVDIHPRAAGPLAGAEAEFLHYAEKLAQAHRARPAADDDPVPMDVHEPDPEAIPLAEQDPNKPPLEPPESVGHLPPTEQP